MDLESLLLVRAEEQMSSGAWRNEDTDTRPPPPKFKEHEPAGGRCRRWGCHAKVRCKGLCSKHYFQTRDEARRAAK